MRGEKKKGSFAHEIDVATDSDIRKMYLFRTSRADCDDNVCIYGAYRIS